MPSNGSIAPSTLSLKDLLWQVQWDKDRCTLCGHCTAVCPVNAIELGVHRKRVVETATGLSEVPSNVHQVYYSIRQKTDPAYKCVGCAMCALVCPNDAIIPCRSDETDKLRYHVDRGGQPRRDSGNSRPPSRRRPFPFRQASSPPVDMPFGSSVRVTAKRW